jgi:hypothetical protein
MRICRVWKEKNLSQSEEIKNYFFIRDEEGEAEKETI